MTCPVFDDLSAFADDALESGERKRLAGHFLSCSRCQDRLDQLMATRAALRALPSPTLGVDLAERFMNMHPATPRKHPLRGAWTLWPQAGLTVAALVSGVWLGGLLAGGASVAALPVPVVRAFDPVPPGGLCAAPELCRFSKGTR